MTDKPSKKVLLTKNEELDKRIGGIPLPSLVVIEGPNDSGKSVLAQQMIYGGLECDLRICYISSEGSGSYILSAMENLGFNVKGHYLSGRLGLISLHVKGMEWAPEVAKEALFLLVNYFKRKSKKYDLFVVDSLTLLFTKVDDNSVLNFLSEVRRLIDDENFSFIFTLHHYALNQEQLVRIRSISDTHFQLAVKEMGEKLIRILEVLKVRGATKPSSFLLSFEVDSNFGIKVLPFTQVRL
ncbi:MAG: hypothetical protein NZ920_02120 [Aigarchaeota archaeon]|nr:hypothetical protein [Aigarchaeota archaeon]MDW8092578.1 ATPase domain-containing protein [Nitrososphaerota archaeon]